MLIYWCFFPAFPIQQSWLFPSLFFRGRSCLVSNSHYVGVRQCAHQSWVRTSKGAAPNMLSGHLHTLARLWAKCCSEAVCFSDFNRLFLSPRDLCWFASPSAIYLFHFSPHRVNTYSVPDAWQSLTHWILRAAHFTEEKIEAWESKPRSQVC